MFFKNREFRIKMVKTPQNEDTTTPTMEQVLNPDSVKLIEETGQKFVKYLAVTVVAMVVTIKVVDVLGEIAVKKFEATIR